MLARVLAQFGGGRALGTAACGVSLGRQEYAITPPFRQAHEQVMEYLGNLFNLEGRVAMVSGATGGVGKALCLALARAGADVVVSDLEGNKDKGNALVKDITALGRSATWAPCDVRDAASVDAALAQVDREFGRLHSLVANAGILGDMQNPEEILEANWRNVFATNVDGVMHCARAAYPLMKRNGGNIVITSSVAGMTGYGPQAAYCASKGALIPLAKSLALAWAPDGINVNAVLPGAANTPFTRMVLNNPDKLAYILDRIPLKRLAEPEDIVGPIMFLLSPASAYCTGATLVVDGGGTSRAMAQ